MTAPRFTTVRTSLIAISATLWLAASVVGAAPAGSPVQVGVNKRLPVDGRAVARAREIPGLAVNPANPKHIVEIDEDFLSGYCDFHVTLDGGRTWSGGHLTPPEGFPGRGCKQFDMGGYAHSNGSVVWGSGQNVYTSFTSAQTGESESVLVARSTDGGRTFEPAVVAIPGTPGDRPVVQIRPRLGVFPQAGGDKVYVIATGCDAVAVQGGGACNRTAFGASADGGRTWRSTRSIASPIEGVTSASSQPALGPDGTVYVAIRRGVAASFPRNLFLAVSKDAGATWAFEEIGTVANPVVLQLVADRQGGLYLATGTTQFAADSDIALLRRPAGATAWSAPVRVNDDAVGNGAMQRLPWLSISQQGVLELLWHDRRHRYQGQNLEDYYYARSTDGGATFATNRRVTDRTRNVDVGLSRGVTGGFYWPALVSLGDGTSIAAWGDSREGDLENNNEDIYLSTITVGGRGPLPRQTLSQGDAASRSAALSRLAHPGGGEPIGTALATKVVIVNATDVAGLLVGSVLARSSLGPVLVSKGNGLSAVVQKEIRRLGPTGALLVGDTRSLSAGVVRDLVKAGVAENTVTRYAGTNPADTARLAAHSLDTRTDDQKTAKTPAFAAAVVINPASPDAAAAGAMAAALRLPILLTGRDAVPAATTTALNELAIDTTLVIGGPTAISNAVLATLPKAKRLGGRDTRATSMAVAAESQARGLPLNIAYLADSTRPTNGALLAAMIARRGGLLLLTPHADATLAENDLTALRLRPLVDRLIVTPPAP